MAPRHQTDMAEESSPAERERAVASREHARLYEVLDQDPARAVAEARTLAPGPDLRDVNVKAMRAAIFIDAGSQLGDAHLVAEAVELLREIDASTSPQFAYNLANGLAALAKLTGKGEPGQLDTASERQEARVLFQHAADNCSDPSIKSSSLTNHANLFCEPSDDNRAQGRVVAAERNAFSSWTPIHDSRSGQLSERFPDGNGLSVLCVRHRHREHSHSHADPIRLRRVSSALVRSGGKTVVSQRRDEDLRGPVTAAFWLGAAVAAVIDPQRQGRNAMIVAASITVCLSAYVISLINVASRPVPPGAAHSGANVYPPQSPNVPP